MELPRMVYLYSMKIIIHSGKEEWRPISWRKVTKYGTLFKMDLHQPRMISKKNLINDAKEKNIIISGLIESAYHKVLGCKTAKNVTDKLENIYAGDSNVKDEKLQIYREKFEQLIMKEDGNIAAYFQYIDEITILWKDWES